MLSALIMMWAQDACTVEGEIAKIRGAQARILERTRGLQARWTGRRRDIADAKMLALLQRHVAERLGDLERAVRHDGAKIFAFALEMVLFDMEESQDALGRADVAVAQQELLARVLAQLDGLARRRAERPSPPGGCGGPARPSVTTLRLLGEIQSWLLARTRAVARGIDPRRQDLADPERQALRRISDEQGRLAGLLRGLLRRYGDR